MNVKEGYVQIHERVNINEFEIAVCNEELDESAGVNLTRVELAALANRCLELLGMKQRVQQSLEFVIS